MNFLRAAFVRVFFGAFDTLGLIVRNIFRVEVRPLCAATTHTSVPCKALVVRFFPANSDQNARVGFDIRVQPAIPHQA